jgi:amino acid adenylation domain-containing protein/non-ribosomal peptide synthase protein (TIGR01720 family)
MNDLRDRISQLSEHQREQIQAQLSYRKRGFPLSHSQRQLWSYQQLDPASCAYNLSFAIELVGVLDMSALQIAVQALVDRHRILQTTYPSIDGEPRQVISPRREVMIYVVDMSSSRCTDNFIRDLAKRETGRPFDLSEGPIFRLLLIRSSTSRHVLAISVHHIAFDGWSESILVRELTRAYSDARGEVKSVAPPLPIQYFDFVLWQQQNVENGTFASDLDFWKERLFGVPLLEMPTDRPRQSVLSSRGDRVHFHWSTELYRQLEQTCRKLDVSLYMTILATYQLILSRYSGQQDILVASVVSGRTRTETQDLIGCFASTVLHRGRISTHKSFREFVNATKLAVLGTLDHIDVPLAKIIEEITLDRDLGRTPGFQASFALQRVSGRADPKGGDLHVANFPIGGETTQSELALSMYDSGHDLSGNISFATDIYDRRTAESIVEFLEQALNSIIEDPDIRLSSICLMNETERERIHTFANGPKDVHRLNEPVHVGFRRMAASVPDMVALVHGDDCVTYACLDQRSDQIAKFLSNLGVGVDLPIVLFLDPGIDLVASMLGVLKAGASYIALDTQLPDERLHYIIEDVCSPFVITQKSIAMRLPAGGHQFVYVTDCSGYPRSIDEAITPSSLSMHSAAYVIYTSGSSGKPKGVVITHEGLTNLACSDIQGMEIGPGTRVIQFASWGFDASVWEWTRTFLRGGTLVIANRTLLSQGVDLGVFLRRYQVEVATLPPSLLRGIDGKYPALRCVVSAGEQCTRDVLTRWSGVVTLLNAYGPTEATICATVAEISSADDSVTIGSPITNVSVYVLDPQGEICPAGVPGEICIGGAGVARCYMHQPVMTSERFVPDAFSGLAGHRLYRTGDKGRWLPQGNLEYLGRFDEQVKIRGYRVEPGEVESALSSLPGVRQVAVFSEIDTTDRVTLFAAIVTDQDDKYQDSQVAAELKALVSSLLPGYMTPIIFIVSHIPLTISGKVDRVALAALRSRERQDAPITLARNDKERILVEIWERTLGVKPIGINDNFFDLGGDSVVSVQVVARANQAGLNIAPRDVFIHQTIANLALCDRARPITTVHDDSPSVPFNLSPIQAWMFEQGLSRPERYVQSITLSAGYDLDIPCFALAINALVVHHPALRTCFKESDGRWMQQVVSSHEKDVFHIVDIGGMSGPRAEAIMVCIALAADRNLSLEKGRLLNIVLFTSADDKDHRILFVIHHLAIDGVSWRIILDDLRHAYMQARLGKEISLLPAATSYMQWVNRLVASASGIEMQEEMSYWRKIQKPRAPWNSKYGKANSAMPRGVVIEKLSERETTLLIRDLYRSQGIAMQEALLAAVALAITGYTGTSEVAVDLEGYGRTSESVEVDLTRTVGWFTSLYPNVIERVPGGSPLVQALDIKRRLAAVPNGGTGFGLLRYLHPDAAVRKQMAELSASAICFNYLGQFDQAINSQDPWAPSQKQLDVVQGRETAYLLEITASVWEGILQTTWRFADGALDRSACERMAADCQETLRLLASEARYAPLNSPVRTYPLANLSEEQLDMVIDAAMQSSSRHS